MMFWLMALLLMLLSTFNTFEFCRLLTVFTLFPSLISLLLLLLLKLRVIFEDPVGEEKNCLRSRLSNDPREGEKFLQADFCLGDYNLASYEEFNLRLDGEVGVLPFLFCCLLLGENICVSARVCLLQFVSIYFVVSRYSYSIISKYIGIFYLDI